MLAKVMNAKEKYGLTIGALSWPAGELSPTALSEIKSKSSTNPTSLPSLNSDSPTSTTNPGTLGSCQNQSSVENRARKQSMEHAPIDKTGDGHKFASEGLDTGVNGENVSERHSQDDEQGMAELRDNLTVEPGSPVPAAETKIVHGSSENCGIILINVDEYQVAEEEVETTDHIVEADGDDKTDCKSENEVSFHKSVMDLDETFSSPDDDAESFW